MMSWSCVVSYLPISKSRPRWKAQGREQQQPGGWPSLEGWSGVLLALQSVSGEHTTGKYTQSSRGTKSKFLLYNSVHTVNKLHNFKTLLPSRRCCRRSSGLLVDQWTIQTTASDHNGAQSSAAAEALWWSYGHPGRHPVDRSGSANSPSDGKLYPEATAYRRSPRVYHQRAPGTGALCGLVSEEKSESPRWMWTVFMKQERLFIAYDEMDQTSAQATVVNKRLALYCDSKQPCNRFNLLLEVYLKKWFIH